MSAALIPVIRHAQIRSWPLHDVGGAAAYVPLAEAMTREFNHDAHFAMYSLPEVPRRLSSEALGHPALPDGIRLSLVAFDIDGPNHVRSPKWWTTEQFKFDCLRRRQQPDAFGYATRGGWRLVCRLPEPIVLRAREDAERFSKLYLAWLDELQRGFCIRGDASCAQWHRLFRLPHATREEGGSPERLEILGDPTRIGIWESAWTLDDFKPKPTLRAGSSDYNGHGILFTLFEQAGMLGHQVRPGVWRAVCPQEERHTSGKRFDGSTVLYAAAPGHIWGHLHCSHGHCAGLKLNDFVDV